MKVAILVALMVAAGVFGWLAVNKAKDTPLKVVLWALSAASVVGLIWAFYATVSSVDY